MCKIVCVFDKCSDEMVASPNVGGNRSGSGNSFCARIDFSLRFFFLSGSSVSLQIYNELY